MSSYPIGPDRAIPCKECGATSYVIDSRPRLNRPNGEDYIYRRRKCVKGHRFTTNDKPEETA